MNKRITRLQLLKTLGAMAGYYGLGLSQRPRTAMARTMSQGDVAQVSLQSGWNLISTPLIPDGPSLPGVLSSMAGKYDMVYTYNPAAGGQPWRHYDPGMPTLLSTLTSIDARWGYWIRATEATTLTLVGTMPTSTTIPLVAGWNLVGFPSNHAVSVSEALAELESNYTEIRTFMDGTWLRYVPGGTATLSELLPGQGYWLHVNSPANWVVAGVSPDTSSVIHIYDSGAVTWDGSSGNYYDYVTQSAVNDMVDRGVMELTGTSTVANAWRALIPAYQPGQGIAIKLNFNNSQSCGGATTAIDGIIEPVNSIVRGLKQIGAQESDVWVFDAIRAFPDRFVNGCQYSGVRFFDNGCHTLAGFYGSGDPTAVVSFSPPPGAPTPASNYITDLLVSATYLINMPIMKRHSGTGVTLGFKNHYGTTSNPGGLHNQAYTYKSGYRSDYSPTVDLYQNPHILNKTVLTLGDGLFAAYMHNMAPRVWSTFGNNVPKSLFFSRDPVAIDCVLYDFLDAETSLATGSDDYLRLAGDAGLGTFEFGDPWGSGYNDIDYRRINLG
jgi:hypothetical protein